MLIIISFVKCFVSKPTDVVYVVHAYNAVGVCSNLTTGLCRLCLLDCDILINWMSPFPVLEVFHF